MLRMLCGTLVMVALIVGVGVVAEANGRANTAQGAVLEDANMKAVMTEREAAGVAVVAPGAPEESNGYPPPAWPGPATPPARVAWAYASASLDEIAATALQQCIARRWASPETKVLHARDWSAADAERLGAVPETVLAGSPVDVAVTLDGELVSMFAGSYGVPPKVHPYAVAFVDRASGSIYSMGFYDSLDEVPSDLR